MTKISPFDKKVYQLVKKVPKGKVTTYKQIAQALHCRAYQAVGQALRKNPYAFTLHRTLAVNQACARSWCSGAGPYAPLVPCHRVVKSNGSIGGFAGKTSGKEIKRKIRMLKKEGIEFKNNKIRNFNKILFQYF